MNVLTNLFDTLTARDAHNQLVPGGSRCRGRSTTTDLAVRAAARREVPQRRAVRRPDREVQHRAAARPEDAVADRRAALREAGRRVVDGYTVDFVLTSAPDPMLPAKLSLFGGVMVPPKYLSRSATRSSPPHRSAPARSGSRAERGVTTSCGCARTRVLGQQTGVRRAGDPHDPDPASALAALQSDEVDLVTGLAPDAALQLEGYKGVSSRHSPGCGCRTCRWTPPPAVRDVRVRRALNHAMDVPLLIKAMLNGKAREVPTMFPRESFGFDPSIAPYTRDLDQAKQLLAQAGFPDGLRHTRSPPDGRPEPRRSHLRAPGQRRGPREVDAGGPVHLHARLTVEQPQGARPDLPRRQHRLDARRRKPRAVQRPPRPAAEPLDQPRGRPAGRRRREARSCPPTGSGPSPGCSTCSTRRPRSCSSTRPTTSTPSTASTGHRVWSACSAWRRRR